ncbi:hypothetical protein [Thermococcus sp. LS2]|uniref:hypothetical protein n=1 Tax=Thermococcus sp. LS2 TaxID=1638260 RepID=UPI00143A6163|nr:hypothetical protein [Thermococcus sp. LS2]NJE11840.1 hypothetical protein [Thermococcus sp. LS2]
MTVMKKIELLGRYMLIICGILMIVGALLLGKAEFIGWGLFQIFTAMALTERSDLCRKFGIFGLLFGGIIMLIISAAGRDTYSLVLSIFMLNLGMLFLTGKAKGGGFK